MIHQQYISRSDMWRVRLALRNACVFTGRRVTCCGVRADVAELRRNGQVVLGGVINESTSFVFRSRLAQLTLCIQVSVCLCV